MRDRAKVTNLQETAYDQHKIIMLKRLLLAVVGMAMGGLAGLLFDLIGLGNAAIVFGALAGGLIFALAAPRLAKN